MIYFTQFKTLEEYNQIKSNEIDFPNVSLIEELIDSEVVKFANKYDYSKAYFTFEAIDDCCFNYGCYYGELSFSIDNGKTWSEYQNSYYGSEYEDGINVSAGNKILFKGRNFQCGESDHYIFEERNYTNTGNNVRFNVEGNIMSLLYGDDFIGKTNLLNSYEFNNLLCGLNIINAEHLILPATTLTEGCYRNMFYGCTLLTTAPSILPATTLVDHCYYYMFNGCTALTTAPALPATTLADYCYSYMFEDCTSLTTSPELPATALADYCYEDMFSGCTALTTAPELPATTLSAYCYNHMFDGCTALTAAPELPATTLADYCYQGMFSGCTSLNSIIMLATDISTNYCLYEWVNNVAASGTFTKAASMTGLPTGVNGIPSGWTVQDYVES